MLCWQTRGEVLREMGKNGSCWKMTCLVTQERNPEIPSFQGNLYISGKPDIKWHLFWRITPVDVSGWQPWLVLSRKDRVVDPFQMAFPWLRYFPYTRTGWWFQIFFIFTGKMIQCDDHIFQMGWFNHHLVVVGDTLLKKKTFWTQKMGCSGRCISFSIREYFQV